MRLQWPLHGVWSAPSRSRAVPTCFPASPPSPLRTGRPLRRCGSAVCVAYIAATCLPPVCLHRRCVGVSPPTCCSPPQLLATLHHNRGRRHLLPCITTAAAATCFPASQPRPPPPASLHHNRGRCHLLPCVTTPAAATCFPASPQRLQKALQSRDRHGLPLSTALDLHGPTVRYEPALCALQQPRLPTWRLWDAVGRRAQHAPGCNHA